MVLPVPRVGAVTQWDGIVCAWDDLENFFICTSD